MSTTDPPRPRPSVTQYSGGGDAAEYGYLAVGIAMRVKGLRWIGVLIAGLNAIAQLAFISAYPLLSLALFTLDILVIYGLVVHGSRSSVR